MGKLGIGVATLVFISGVGLQVHAQRDAAVYGDSQSAMEQAHREFEKHWGGRAQSIYTDETATLEKSADDGQTAGHWTVIGNFHMVGGGEGSDNNMPYEFTTAHSTSGWYGGMLNITGASSQTGQHLHPGG